MNSGSVFSTILTMVLVLAISAVSIYMSWKVFVKAGYEGWKCLIPYYNMYIMFQIAGMNGWLFLSFMVPCVNIVMTFVLLWKFFGKFELSMGIRIASMFIPLIGMAIIAFNPYVEYGAE